MSRRAPALARPADIAEALALLTRLPVTVTNRRGAAAAWAWPVAGLVTALIAGCLGLAALRLGLAPALAAAFILALQIALTGALHEDGLADSADGFWGGPDRARRLEIMKDSRIGSYGVLALGLALIARWSALTLLVEAGWLLGPLLATAALSRAPMAALSAALPNARGTGLAKSVGRPGQNTVLLGIALAFLSALLAVGWSLLAPAFWIVLTTAGLGLVAKAKIGGQTGDVLGAGQQLAEIAALAVFASLV